MEELNLSSSILIEFLKENSDLKIQEEVIIRHITSNETSNVILDDFPAGQDWFNTTCPLNFCKHLKGKLVVLDFFTYCCINCIHILPHLKILEKNFSVEDGVVVVGVHSAKFDNEKSSSNIGAAIRRYDVTHAVVNDADCVLWTNLGVACWPTVLILGPERQPLLSLVGEFDSHHLQLFVRCAVSHFSGSLSRSSLPQLRPQGGQLVSSSSSPLLFPGKVAASGHLLAVSDSGHHRVLIINTQTGIVEFCAGGPASGFQDGSFTSALFNSPQGLAFVDQSTLYVADTENHAVRMLSLKDRTVTTILGTGQQGYDLEGGEKGTLQAVSSPWDLCLVPAYDVALPAIPSFPTLPLQPVGGVLPPPPPPPPGGSHIPHPPPPCPPGTLTPRGATPVRNKDTKVLLMAMSGCHQIWAYFLEDTTWWKARTYKKGSCVAVAGSGKEENRNSQYPRAAAFAQPSGLSYNSKHKAVLIADSESSSIRKLSVVDGSVTAVVGGDATPNNLFSYGLLDGHGHGAKLQHPLGVSCHAAEPHVVYVADTYNHVLRRVDLSSRDCSTVQLEGPGFSEPGGVCEGEIGDVLYVADTNNHVIKAVDLKEGKVTEITINEKRKQEKSEDSREREAWTASTSISTRGGHLTIHVSLPPDTHGKWRVADTTTGCHADLKTGAVDSEIVALGFVVPEGGHTGLEVLFDLVLCGESACLFKKCTLKVHVERSSTAPELSQLDICPLAKSSKPSL